MIAHGLFLAVIVFALSKTFHYPFTSFSITSLSTIFVSAVFLMASHGISYSLNFIGKQEFLRISPAAQMMQPYQRVVVMHVTVVLGLIFAFIFRSFTPLLMVMILSKIAVDVFSHINEHKNLEPSNQAPTENL